MSFDERIKFDLHDNWDPSLFTNPLEHNDDNYMYIVYAVTDPNDSSLAAATTRQMATSIITNGQGTSVNVDIISNPTDIYKKPIICGSVVDSKKHGTWKGVGLILRVPKQNILYASSSDAGTNMTDREGTIKRFAHTILKSPQQTLDGASEFGYTEVVMLGETEFGRVESIRSFL